MLIMAYSGVPPTGAIPVEDLCAVEVAVTMNSRTFQLFGNKEKVICFLAKTSIKSIQDSVAEACHLEKDYRNAWHVRLAINGKTIPSNALLGDHAVRGGLTDFTATVHPGPEPEELEPIAGDLCQIFVKRYGGPDISITMPKGTPITHLQDEIASKLGQSADYRIYCHVRLSIGGKAVSSSSSIGDYAKNGDVISCYASMCSGPSQI